MNLNSVTDLLIPLMEGSYNSLKIYLFILYLNHNSCFSLASFHHDHLEFHYLKSIQMFQRAHANELTWINDHVMAWEIVDCLWTVGSYLPHHRFIDHSSLLNTSPLLPPFYSYSYFSLAFAPRCEFTPFLSFHLFCLFSCSTRRTPEPATSASGWGLTFVALIRQLTFVAVYYD